MAISAAIVTVSTAATSLSAGGPGANDIRTIMIRNDSGVDLFIGGPTVTTATGLKVPTATNLTLDLGPGDDLYGIIATATQPIQVLRTRA